MKYLSIFSLLFTANNIFGLSPYAYITNNGGTSVQVIDVFEDTIQYIFGFDNPRVVKLSPDGSKAFVGEMNGHIQIINTADHTIETMPTTVPTPIALAITPNSKFLYIASSDNTVTAIRTSDYGIQAVISGFDSPGDLKVSSNGILAYVTNQTANTISVINISENTIIDTIIDVMNPKGFTITNDGKFGYATDAVNNVLYKVDLSTNTVIATVVGFNTPRYMVMSSDDQYAFITCTGDDSVVKLRLSDNQIAGEINIPAPRSLGITPDGLYLFVGSNLGAVYKVSILENEIVSAVPGFNNPSNISIADINPPKSTVNGCHVEETDGMMYNNIYWEKAPGNPSGYRIYRDAGLTHPIATLPASETTYTQLNLINGQSYWYYLVADYTNGFSSTQGSVKVTPTRTCLMSNE